MLSPNPYKQATHQLKLHQSPPIFTPRKFLQQQHKHIAPTQPPPSNNNPTPLQISSPLNETTTSETIDQDSTNEHPSPPIRPVDRASSTTRKLVHLTPM